MRVSHSIGTLIILAVAFGLAGCRRAPKEWRIIAHNQSAGYAEVSMDIGPGAGINAPDLAGGERRVLMSGSSEMVVRAVKVVVNRRQAVFSPKVEVPLGKGYILTIGSHGDVRGSLVDL